MTIHPLADYPQFLEQIARWNVEEWPSYFDGNLHNAIAFNAAAMTRHAIPTCLVAVEDGMLAGTVSLLPEDMDIRPGYSPWLASLYVERRFRGRGFARALVAAGMQEARAQGIPVLYVWTRRLRRLFEAHGWRHLENVGFLGDRVDILTVSLIE